MTEITLTLTKTELDFIIKKVDQDKPYCYEVDEERKPDALMWVRVMKKLCNARSGRQKKLEVHA